MKVVFGYFDQYDQAQSAINQLRNKRFSYRHRLVALSEPWQADLRNEGTGFGFGVEIATPNGGIVSCIIGLLIGMGIGAEHVTSLTVAVDALPAAFVGAGFGAVTDGILGAVVDTVVPGKPQDLAAEAPLTGVLAIMYIDDNQQERICSILHEVGMHDLVINPPL